MRLSPPPELSTCTTLRLGGAPRQFVVAEADAELIEALSQPEPALLLGGGSNLVIADEGFDGTVVQVATRGVRFDGLAGERTRVTAAAGEPWDELVAICAERGLAGLECLSGIPGRVGAVPIQNVGAYGQEVSGTLVSVRLYDRIARGVVEMRAEQCQFGYRTSVFRGGSRYAVLGVTFALRQAKVAPVPRYAELRGALGLAAQDDQAQVPLAALRETVLALRRKKGMVLAPDDPDSVSAGSFFTNPELSASDLARTQELVRARCGAEILPTFPAPSGLTKVSAAWLIERAGFARGYGAGRVGISTKHTLALVHRGGGSTRELLALAREVRAGVRAAFAVTLEPEPVFVGVSL